MIVLLTFKDISRKIHKINRESWLLKIHVIVTGHHIICHDTDNFVEFFKTTVDDLKGFVYKLDMLYQVMLNYDYSDIGKIRPEKSKRYSRKLYELWKQASEKKSLKLSLMQ